MTLNSFFHKDMLTACHGKYLGMSAVRKASRNTFKRLLIIRSVCIFVIEQSVIHHFIGHRELENSAVTDALNEHD